MKREKTTITDEGAITVPTGVRMTVIEIANLFGVFHQTAKRHIRSIEKSGVAGGDYKMTCIVDGHGVHPEFYGLDMVAAVAFRVKSWQADIFRRWLIERAVQPQKPCSLSRIPVFVPMDANKLPNCPPLRLLPA